MGLTCKSCKLSSFNDIYKVEKKFKNQKVVALAGNPNTGKSTVFNALTGLKQHTGNWPGKTVTNAQGTFKFNDKEFILVDLPGTYSLLSNSVEEEVARDFLCFGEPDATIVVIDATCLERNLNLALQIMEITNNVILCVNLLDEAKRKKITLDIKELSNKLGIPVVGTIARKKIGLDELMKATYDICFNNIQISPIKIKYPENIENEIDNLLPKITPFINNKLNPRWVALRILDGDNNLLCKIKKHYNCKDICEDKEVVLSE